MHLKVKIYWWKYCNKIWRTACLSFSGPGTEMGMEQLTWSLSWKNQWTCRRNVSVDFGPHFVATYWTPLCFAMLPCILLWWLCHWKCGALLFQLCFSCSAWQQLRAFSHAEVRSGLTLTTVYKTQRWCGVSPAVRWYCNGSHSQIPLLLALQRCNYFRGLWLM